MQMLPHCVNVVALFPSATSAAAGKLVQILPSLLRPSLPTPPAQCPAPKIYPEDRVHRYYLVVQ